MIIHDSDRLHEGITDGRAYKAEATFSQVLTHAVGLIGAGGHVPGALGPFTAFFWGKLPDVFFKAAELFLDRRERLRVLNYGGDLHPVADDSRIGKERSNLLLVVLHNDLGSEPVKRFAIVFALPEDRLPTQPGLCAFETEKFKQSSVIVQ